MSLLRLHTFIDLLVKQWINGLRALPVRNYVEVREELGFLICLKLSIYESEVASAKYASH